jgi:hypothetical protein
VTILVVNTGGGWTNPKAAKMSLVLKSSVVGMVTRD